MDLKIVCITSSKHHCNCSINAFFPNTNSNSINIIYEYIYIMRSGNDNLIVLIKYFQLWIP